MKVGIPKEYFIEGMDPEVEKAVREAVKTLEGLGAKVVEVSLPHTGLCRRHLLHPCHLRGELQPRAV